MKSATTEFVVFEVGVCRAKKVAPKEIRTHTVKHIWSPAIKTSPENIPGPIRSEDRTKNRKGVTEAGALMELRLL